MIGNNNNNLYNLVNTNIGGYISGKTSVKTSENLYYNIFSKKLETIELPDIDLEFNNVLVPEKSTFMRTS